MNTPLKKRSGRVLAVDYGHVRIGLAISDPFGIAGQLLKNIQGDKKIAKTTKKIETALLLLEKEKGFLIDTIIIGLPLNLNGTESERSKEVREVASLLILLFPEKKVLCFDERLTSLQAERVMKETGQLSRKERAKQVDSIAALILLQSYLDTIL